MVLVAAVVPVLARLLVVQVTHHQHLQAKVITEAIIVHRLRVMVLVAVEVLEVLVQMALQHCREMVEFQQYLL